MFCYIDKTGVKRSVALAEATLRCHESQLEPDNPLLSDCPL